MSGFLKINTTDLAKGLVVAVLGAIFIWLAQVFNAPGFEFASINWGDIVKIAVSAGIAYLGKNLLSTENGKFLGVIG